MIFVRPDDANYQSGASVITVIGKRDGASEAFTLQMAQHQLRRNVIFIKPAQVGDLAWLDTDRNGLIDQNEPPLSGVTVRLLKDGAAAYEVVTDAYGYYLFDDVYPGTYTLQAAAYPQLGITTGVPELRLISSCLVSGDGQTAQSEPFDVVSGTKRMDFKLGYVLLDGQTMPQMQTAPQKDWTGAYKPQK